MVSLVYLFLVTLKFNIKQPIHTYLCTRAPTFEHLYVNTIHNELFIGIFIIV
jgi:hypothetical protein